MMLLSYSAYRSSIFLSIILLLFGGGLFAASYPDIEQYEYREAVELLTQRDIVKGYPDGTFGPDRTVTRAELLKIVLESTVADQLQANESCFPDIDPDDWYAAYFCYAQRDAILKGYPDGTAQPDNPVTIAEALKMSINAFSQGVQEGIGNNRYMPYIDFVHTNNLFSKYALHPHAEMSRGRVAHLVASLIEDSEGSAVLSGVRDARSPGCFLPTPSVVPTTTMVDGVTRSFLTTIGKTYSPYEPMPLIIAFHGRTNSNHDVRRYYTLDRVTDGEAIILYPSALPENTTPRNRRSPGDPSDKLRDFAFFDRMVEDMSNKYCVDLDQIYVVGHSLGAWFTNSLACARGDVIRAIGSVGGGTTINTCTGPAAAVIMQHPADNLSSYRSGVVARDQLLEQNGCGPQTRPVGPSRGGCVEYTNCLADAPVMWCEHSDDRNRDGSYYPHKRPDDAGKYIWQFFNGL